jgi:hypothetical protein
MIDSKPKKKTVKSSFFLPLFSCFYLTVNFTFVLLELLKFYLL